MTIGFIHVLLYQKIVRLRRERIKMSLISLEYKDESLQTQTLEFSQNLLSEPFKKESLFVIRVEGESMQPKINDKALVVADLSSTDIENGSIYLVMQNEKMWIKEGRVDKGAITFISINPDFSHLVFQQEECRVIAKAVLTFTKL